MHRFFVPPGSFSQTGLIFPDDISFQIRRVLRLEDGEIVAVLDNSGLTRLVAISCNEKGQVSGRVESVFQEKRELPIRLDLFVSLTSREKFEWILQKATEAGVSRVIPFISERSLVQSVEKDPQGKKELRRKAIMREAAEQCERTVLPVLEPAVSFQQAVRSVERNGRNLFFWEQEKARTIWQSLDNDLQAGQLISLMTGPEGGFTAAEADFARANGWQIVTLGERILRMETAAVAAILQTAYEIARRQIFP